MTENATMPTLSGQEQEKFPVRFIGTYQLASDEEGAEWMAIQIEHAKKDGLIEDGKVLTSEYGVWGLQMVVFTIDCWLPDMGFDEAKENGTVIAAKIVGETDVEVLWTTSLVGREAGN